MIVEKHFATSQLLELVAFHHRPPTHDERDSFYNDAKLLGRAFAFVYIGSIVDQAISDPISDDLREEVVSDMSSALDARQAAVDRGVAKAVTDIYPFAHTGYKLVSRLLRTDQPLIESLARELTSQITMKATL